MNELLVGIPIVLVGAFLGYFRSLRWLQYTLTGIAILLGIMIWVELYGTGIVGALALAYSFYALCFLAGMWLSVLFVKAFTKRKDNLHQQEG